MRRLLPLLALLLVAGQSLAATLYVTEFKGAPPTSVYYQAVTAPQLATGVVNITGVSAQSSAFTALTGIVRIHTDTACMIVVGGTNPTATTGSMRLAAGQTEYFVVSPGDKVAVILAP